ncbi:diguanylate cyclase (GGDEF)-like protein [Stackebrandtia albiflava]|uniref:Diguanylate cyclase (GGDEF)-like protein n=1 Tax=Stackebrandtia albiflava TaxID=406432 RepID=A0A562UQV8_9ACTN|nr:EAL domain-containing protein [Stackebrandtia albiflava]TWJ08000.1 diguanylate cyclase (GGDEF)-like protein [Stackebrandtia albiflava]
MTTTSLRNTAPSHRRGVFFGYIWSVIGLALVTVGVTLFTTPPVWIPELAQVPAAMWLLAAMAVLVEWRPLLPPGSRFSPAAMISLGFIMALLLGWGYLPALVVQTVVAALIFHRLGATAWRIAFNAAQFALALTASHLVLLAFGGAAGALLHSGTGLLALLLAGTAWFLVSHLLVCTAWSLRFSVSWLRMTVQSLGYEAVVHFAQLALAPILAVAAGVNAWLVLLSAVPIYAVYRMARLSSEHERMALSDSLTGLPNRKGFRAVVEDNLSRTAESGGRMAVLICDLDRFAAVNNSLGHAVGDRLLRELARRFQVCGDRPHQLVARIGGDEFGFLLAEYIDESEVVAFAERIQAALAEPVWLDEISVDVSGAIGMACYPQDGRDFDTLFRHADVAMYEAKSRGSGLARYAPEYDHHSPQRLALLGDLRRALEAPDLPGVELYYQPQIELSSGEVVGVEALLRYRHPTQGSVDPAELIALAEHSAVMRTLTYRVIDEAVSQLASWRRAGLRLRASVNVSVRDLHAQDFCDYLVTRLREHRVPPASLRLEITESALMADPRRVVATLKRLEELGVGLSLDDFGTGFSSMQHLRRLQVTEVKIDKSFVLGMRDDADAVAIVRSIIELGRALGLQVVAEGVEDERTWRQLRHLNCDMAQGWFHAKPMPAGQLAGWLHRYRPPVLPHAVPEGATVPAESV